MRQLRSQISWRTQDKHSEEIMCNSGSDIRDTLLLSLITFLVNYLPYFLFYLFYIFYIYFLFTY